MQRGLTNASPPRYTISTRTIHERFLGNERERKRETTSGPNRIETAEGTSVTDNKRRIVGYVRIGWTTRPFDRLALVAVCQANL